MKRCVMWNAAACLGVIAALAAASVALGAEIGPDLPTVPIRPLVGAPPLPPRPIIVPRGPFGPGRLFRVPPPDYRMYAPGRDPRPPFFMPAERGFPPQGRVCFDQSETRENIAEHGLSDPSRAVRFGRSQGETLTAKLCRWHPGEFVYELHVLRRDGRLVRLFMNAQSGELMGGADGPHHEPGAK